MDAPLPRDEWLEWVFAGAKLGDAHNLEVDELVFSVPAPAALAYVTDAFERPRELIGRFSDEELCGGLWFLLHDSGILVGAGTSEEARLRALRATSGVYRELFAERCTPVLSHLDEPAVPLNSPCYMWWDIGPFWSGTPSPHLEACFDVMEGALALEHDACRESALHGLGHFHTTGPLEERRQRLIRDFQARNAGALRPELVRYAEAALSGCIQ